MLFRLGEETCIFIHMPKTGGNTIQASLMEAGLSLDEIIVEDHQDGFDRFKIRGEYTRNKHQFMFRYLADNPHLSSAKAFSCVRRPFERMVSYYFSPHRHVRKRFHFFGPYRLPETVKFDENEFFSLVEKTSTAAAMICPIESDNVDQQRNLISGMLRSNQLTILKTENLSNDFFQHFKFPITRQSRNISPYQEQIRTIQGSLTLRNYVERSKHAIDLELFY